MTNVHIDNRCLSRDLQCTLSPSTAVHVYSAVFVLDINARRMRTRVTVLSLCVCVCVCYQFAGSISSLYNTFSMAIVGLSDFQLTDLSKMPSFLKERFSRLFSNPHKRLCILLVVEQSRHVELVHSI